MEKKLDGFCALNTKEFFEPGHTASWPYISQLAYPWEALPKIRDIILDLGTRLDDSEYIRHGAEIWIHKTASIAPSSYIGNAVIVGAGTEVRHCAYIRESALIGENAVIGNSTELKNVILFDRVQVPHYNYVGDSILGYKSHMGAGAITSNVKSDHSLVAVAFGKDRIDTGMKKFGAILGDNVEVGCNSVLNPGTTVGVGATVYPLSMVRGHVPSASIYKRQGEVAIKREYAL